jgi:hypothetical protein
MCNYPQHSEFSSASLTPEILLSNKKIQSNENVTCSRFNNNNHNNNNNNNNDKNKINKIENLCVPD